MTEIDYATVNRYWEGATASILGPYMMDGFGFPERFQAPRSVGRLTYFMLRLGSPWITRVSKVLGIPFPNLENHFFVLEPGTS